MGRVLGDGEGGLTAWFDAEFLADVLHEVLERDGDGLHHEEGELVLDLGDVGCIQRADMVDER